MQLLRLFPLFVLATAVLQTAAPADEQQVVFRSDVSLVRVDAQVVDRNNRGITGLKATDFVLRDEGKTQEIRNFAREELPIDLLFLLDVSGSMRPHVERIASAAEQALQVLGNDDRVGIMVFDRSTRLRMPFRNVREGVDREFQSLLRRESFNGGTDITRGLLDAATYVMRNGRRGVRRAIVIMTDDQTERERDEARVNRALLEADAILGALIAPNAMYSRGGGGYPGGGRMPRGGGSWPGSGGGLADIILGGGGQGPIGVPGGGQRSRTHSAGTSEIARESGGDSLPVDDAAALDTTIARIRQRYALYFRVPDGAKPMQDRTISVSLNEAARRRYPDAEVRYRRSYRTSTSTEVADNTGVTVLPTASDSSGARDIRRTGKCRNCRTCPEAQTDCRRLRRARRAESIGRRTGFSLDGNDLVRSEAGRGS